MIHTSINVFITFQEKIYCLDYNFLVSKIPGLKNFKKAQVFNDVKDFKDQATNSLLIYFYDKTNKEYVVILNYSKNMNIASKLLNFIHIKKIINFRDVYNFFINDDTFSLNSKVQDLIPTNFKDFVDFMEFAKVYKIKEIENLLVGKQAYFVQNMFK